MKRATLTAYSTTPAAPPADLTDRLLASQAGQPAPAKRRRKPAQPPPPALATAEPEAREHTAPAATPSSLESALSAAAAATTALQQAGREAPARYEVALRFRLDALAHHVQQVAEYVTAVTKH